MTVIAGHRAEELHLVLFQPGLVHTGGAKDHQTVHGVIHKGQAGVAPGQHLLHRHFQQIGKHLPAGRNAFQCAVVAGIQSLIHGVLTGLDHRQHPFTGIQLVGAGLAPGHIQLQALGLVAFVLFVELFQFFFQFSPCGFCQIHTITSNFICFYASIIPSNPYRPARAAPRAVAKSALSGMMNRAS